MANQIWGGLAEGISPFAQELFKSRVKRGDEQRTAKERPAQLTSFIKALEQAGIPMDQLSSVNPQEGTVGFRQPQEDLATVIAKIKAINEASAGQSGGGQMGTSTEVGLPPKVEPGVGVESLPVVNKIAQFSRFAQREIGARKVQSGLLDNIQARTASLAKGLEDSGNIAVQEREMMLKSAPSDGETWEHRQESFGSMMNLFDHKEAEYMKIMNQPTQQVVSGTYGKGIRTLLDPVAVANKKAANEGLRKIRQARVAYQQMYDLANRDMPAIGQPANGSGQPQASQYTRTGVDKKTGRKVGQRQDGTMEYIN